MPPNLGKLEPLARAPRAPKLGHQPCPNRHMDDLSLPKLSGDIQDKSLPKLHLQPNQSDIIGDFVKIHMKLPPLEKIPTFPPLEKIAKEEKSSPFEDVYFLVCGGYRCHRKQ